MTDTHNRLPADAPHGFGGAEINRDRPLRFRLNGRTVHGFEGDTVLSAALASGFRIAGRHEDQPIALDESFCPLVRLGKDLLLPMERTPALNGLDLTTVGTRRDPAGPSGLLSLLRLPRFGRAFNTSSGELSAPLPYWQDAAPSETLSVDFAIIGGGIAGLAAAAAAAAAGKSAVIVERGRLPGGAIGYFGAADGEEPPEALIRSLQASLGARVTILNLADAFAVAGTTVRVHQVTVVDGRPAARVLAVEARHVVVATGMLERLPLFPGNRTPGIVGGLAAYQRAARFGVWPGRRALFTTPHSFAYRVALHAADAGVTVQRIVDSRLAPVSRFVDFAKASGITLASALAPSHAGPLARNQPGLRVGFAVNIDEISQDSTAIETDQLVASGGWQPDLLLWLRAGGTAKWDDAHGWLIADGAVPGISIAGSAAGWRSTAAVVASGKAAVLAALGKRAPAIVEQLIDSAFETPDARTPVAPFRPGGRGSAYLDRGGSFVTRRIAAPGKQGISGLAIRAVQLSIGDIAAAVDIGAITPRDAGAIASERCGLAGEIADTGWRVAAPVRPDPAVVPAPPAWLAGRFGDKPLVWAVSAADARSFGPGCLVFENSHTSDPRQAVGVIYAPPRGRNNGGIALIATGIEGSVFVRDAGTAVAATLVERLKPAG